MLGTKLGTQASFEKIKIVRYFNPYPSPICFPVGPLAKKQHYKHRSLQQEGGNEGLMWKEILKVAKKLNA